MSNEKLSEAQWVGVVDAIRKIKATLREVNDFEDKNDKLTPEIEKLSEEVEKQASELYNLIIEKYEISLQEDAPNYIREEIEDFFDLMEAA